MRRLAQIKTGVENKRHTNAHQPLTDRSPTEVSIPPPPDFPSSVFRGWFSAKHEAGEVVEIYSQACLDGDWEQIHLDWTFSVVETPSRSASLFRSQFCSYRFIHIKNERGVGVLFVAGHEQRELKYHRTVP